MNTAFNEFLRDVEKRRAYLQEKLIVDATEMIAVTMEQKSVTRAELARRIGKSRAFITQALSGGQNLTLRTLADILWAMDSEAAIEAMPIKGLSENHLDRRPVRAQAPACYVKQGRRRISG